MTTIELGGQEIEDWLNDAKKELLAEMTRVKEKLEIYGAWESNGMGKPKVGFPHGTDEWDREKISILRNHHYRLEGRWDMLDWIFPSFLSGWADSVKRVATNLRGY